MRLDTLLVADYAAVSEGKLFVNGGGVTRFKVPSVPFVIPTLSIVMRFLTEHSDYGDHSLLVEFLNPDGLQALPPDPGTVTINEPDESQQITGEENFMQMVLGFAGLPILRSGLHHLRVIWDEELLRDFALPVEVTAPPEPGALGRGAPPPPARRGGKGAGGQRPGR